MDKQMAVVKRLRGRRFAVLLAAYLAAALGVGLSLDMRAGAQGTQPAGANQAAADAQFQKAKALYDSGRFAEAQVENEKALALDPTHNNALLLRRVLAGKVGSAPIVVSTQSGGGGTVVAARTNVLNAQQISMIRLAEWSANDRNLRGKIDRKVLEEFWQEVVLKDPTANQSPQAHEAFLNPTNFAMQAGIIRQSGDTRFISQIQVSSDPASMLVFKTTVQRYVLDTCATADCHSEKGMAGNFQLIAAPITGPGGITPEQQQYTNFYILATYVSKDGGRMIDRENPDHSLFIQYGLPKNVAGAPHPKVDVPRKLGPTDPRYRTMIDWVRTLTFPRPNYGIAFELPGGGGGGAAGGGGGGAAPVTQATQPATSTKPAGK
jgi:tetratricopeptide (TPR) repeat protein